MEDTETQMAIPLFQKKEIRKTHQKPHLGNAVNESSSSSGLSRRRSSRRNRRDYYSVKAHRKDPKRSCCGGGNVDGAGAGEEDEKEAVERKIQALQRIVPGGESLNVDQLFEETADYIMALQCQLKAMRTLATFFEGLEKEKRKLGG